ncbi:hypothetical protein ABMA27_004337 [Loxostege sticticalis]|uniref:ATP-dependent RNA helicase DDX20 n=1 Tax=Loxostege sticticalis TaxID=481309 RepID=A0ABR3HNB7_LOXSC
MWICLFLFSGADLLLEAKSGTGKTAVFTVITLEKLDLEKGLQTVILAPTREIASQICDVIKQIGSYYEGLVVEVVMGGLPVEEDICKFKNKNVHIVVGSPGRLRHLIQDQHINVSSVRLLILDEADKLMEKSFQGDINFIFSILPTQKQVIMSSATYPETTKAFINKYVKCAQHVCPDSNCVLLGVEQKITVVKCNTNIIRQTKYRFEELLKIITKRQFKQCLIFCNYQARVAELYKLLTREKWPVEQLCGQQEQTDRLDALKTLKEYKCRILVSTDLAARGIDASNVDLVINFEPPFEWQTYLHRIGRAGRYGSYGMSITILSEGKEEVKFKSMLEAINLDSLKVKNLWTDDESGNTDHTKNLPMSHVNPESNLNTTELEFICKDVWNDLISVCSSNEKEELEEFDTLCKSFEESDQQKIESFTDLVNSFEDSKNNAPVKDTHHLTKIKPKAIKSFLESMKALKVSNNENTRFPTEKMLPKDSNKKILDVLSNENDNTLNESKDLTDNSILVHKHLNKKLNMNGVDETNKECNNSSDYTADNLDESINKALIDAGLPSSFGTSKNRHNNKSYKKKTKTTRRTFNEEIQDEGIEDFQQNYKHSIDKKIKDNSRHKNKVQYYEKQESHSSKLGYKNKQYNTWYQQKYTQNNSKVRCNSISTNNTTTTSSSHKNKVITQDSYTEDYINWYYQLKNRVKQIEIALYIEEITKL